MLLHHGEAHPRKLGSEARDIRAVANRLGNLVGPGGDEHVPEAAPQRVHLRVGGRHAHRHGIPERVKPVRGERFEGGFGLALQRFEEVVGCRGVGRVVPGLVRQLARCMSHTSLARDGPRVRGQTGRGGGGGAEARGRVAAA